MEQTESLLKLKMQCTNKWCRGSDHEGNPLPPSKLDWSAPVGGKTVCIVCGCGHIYYAPPSPKRKSIAQQKAERDMEILRRIFDPTAELSEVIG